MPDEMGNGGNLRDEEQQHREAKPQSLSFRLPTAHVH
jgi:hypothetical protein